jgi:methyltransferase family protein
MHAAAMKGFTDNLEALPGPWRHSGQKRALDLGGADVNGTVHATLAGYVELSELEVLDVAPGPGVTIVADARTQDWWTTDDFYDLVISTEMLEHVQGWKATIRTAALVLREGGWFVGTCASLGRRPHGARGEYDPPAGEHYANVGPSELVHALSGYGFDAIHVQYRLDPADAHGKGDLYWRARRSAD